MSAPELVPIAEAARRLGVSADTVRRRLKRGELEGEQHPTAQGFTWLVAMPAGSGAAEGAPAEEGAGTGEDVLERATLAERVAGLDRLADELRGDRDAWKAQAERHEEAARELRILVQGAQALARALPANVEDAPETHAEPSRGDEASRMADGASSVWQRLRRRLGGA